MKQGQSFKRAGLFVASVALAGLALGMLFLTLPAAKPAQVNAAAPSSLSNNWIIVVNITGTINIVDPGLNTIYGPFLEGELGLNAKDTVDVAVTPDGRTALISNFSDSAVYFVDVSEPLTPTVVGSVTTPMQAEDIAISHDGQSAYVTDGNFSHYIAVLDIPARTLAYSRTLNQASMQAVDVAPDGTVVVIDYLGSLVSSLYPDATGQLTTTGLYSYSLTDYGEIIGTQYDRRFVNVSIAPDGQTVLVCDIASYTDTQYAQGVFRITSPGVLSLTGVITGLTLPAQSIAFDPSGRKAYLSCNNWSSVDEYDHISVVDITGPGYARLNQDNAAELKPRKTSGQLFGVETIAVAQGRAYVGDPSSTGTNDLQIVNLDDFSVITRTMIPGNVHGVAGFYQPTFYLPDIEKN